MSFTKRTLVIGSGEVGSSLARVLKRCHIVMMRDKEEPDEMTREALKEHGIDVLNICFPYFDGFIDVVREYEKMYRPKYTIIHSTVPPGTTRELGGFFVHSPIHGKHPNLEGGIMTFVKYVGGINKDVAEQAQAFLRHAGINSAIVDSPETSELSKICCTTQYGWMIIITKEIKKLCERYNADFEMVYGWNKFYNHGYEKLGMSQFKRPTLDYMPGKIGGHCVAQNSKLIDSFFTNLVKDKQKEYEASEINKDVGEMVEEPSV
uniref:Uncharacterized protein n=1 Tax=viral metagenome TaxID=1070528 RepID=A0A6H1ZDZ8_9ZZZZ